MSTFYLLFQTFSDKKQIRGNQNSHGTIDTTSVISQQDEKLLVRQSLPQPTKQPRVEIAEGVCSEIRTVVAQPVVLLVQQSDNTLLINTLNETPVTRSAATA